MRVLREQFGIDVAGQRPRHIATLTGRRFDHVVTLCDKAREACPEFAAPAAPGALEHPRTRHGGDPDQAGYPAFRQVAADIDTRVRHLLPSLTSTDQ